MAIAQSGNLRKAKSAYARYEELGGLEAGELATKFLTDAAKPIELAAEHDRTKEDPETWAVYALIYSNLALAEKNEEYAQKTLDGIEKATSLDEEKKNETNIDAARITLRNYYQTIGYDDWQEENFQGAYDAFDKGLQVTPGDTTLLYYSAVAALQTQNYADAVKKYEEIIPFNDYSEHRTVMADLPKLYLTLGDTTKAIEYAQKATEAYPDDSDIALQNIEFNLVAGNEEKIIADIENQLSKNSDNKTLHYYLGVAYSSVDNDEKALESYKNALAIDPDYLEANLNAAVVITKVNNMGIMALNDDKSLSNEEYGKKLNELKEGMGEAVPYLEKAVELDPQHIDALRTLKSYYDFIQDEEKAAEIQAKIDAL